MSRIYRPGETIPGGYLVFDVRRGGMGVVYCTRQPPDRFYAIKTLQSDHDSDDTLARATFARYFRAEVDLWIRLSAESRHENIVHALLFNQDEGWLFLEFVSGLSLHEVGQRKPLHARHALAWAKDIARGMRMLHEDFSLIHRDLKPQNVLVRTRGLVAKITDLGIAKVLEEDLPMDNTVIGTQGYRAPETSEGLTTFQSDIFSFGATLFVMLTGHRHHDRDDGGQTMRARDWNPAIPEPFADLLERCLAPEPEKRPESFAVVLGDLERIDLADPAADDRFGYCEKHDFYGFKSDDGFACAFCRREQMLDEQMKHAERCRVNYQRDRAGAVAAGIPGEMTTADETFAATRSSPPVPSEEDVPQTIPAVGVELPTKSADHLRRGIHTLPDPIRVEPANVGTAPVEPASVKSPWPMRVVLLIVGIAVVWGVVRLGGWGGPDDYHDGGKSPSDGKVVQDSGHGKDSTTSSGSSGESGNGEKGNGHVPALARVLCKDPECAKAGRTLIPKKFPKGLVQLYCDDPKHPHCTNPDCGWRAADAAEAQLNDGWCKACGKAALSKAPGD